MATGKSSLENVHMLWGVVSIIVVFQVQHLTAVTQLGAPGGNRCLGDTLTYECTTFQTGQLVWLINDVVVGTFNVQDDVGTSSQTVPGVTATLTAKDVARAALASTLTIQSAGVDVKVGDIIGCTETPGNVIETRQLSLIPIDVRTLSTEFINFGTAKVTIEEFQDTHSLTTCTREIIFQPVPTTVGIAAPPAIVMPSIEATFRNLDFCSTNYTFQVTPVSINGVNGSTITSTVVSASTDDVVPITDLITTSTGLKWFLANSLRFCLYAGVELSWAPQNRVVDPLDNQDVPQSLLTEAGFPYCVGTTVVASPYLLSLGAVRSKSARNFYTAKPLDFSGPSNLTGTPIFTHDSNGIVTGLAIAATWNAVPPQTFGSNVVLDTTHFTCSAGSNSETCHSATSHRFTVTNLQSFVGPSFSVAVQVDYLECTNLSTNIVSDIITSLPTIEGGMGGTIEIRVQVNPSMVPNGASVTASIAPSTDASSTPTGTTTAMVSNGMLLVQSSALNPDTEYRYTITFLDTDVGKLGRTIQGTFRTALRVFFQLRSITYRNNSAINIANIGTGRAALFCRTDLVGCCRTAPNNVGEFYYPNGNLVRTRRSGDDFYRTRRSGHIRLHRRNGATSPTGQFRCEIPDSSGATQRIFINLTT